MTSLTLKSDPDLTGDALVVGTATDPKGGAVVVADGDLARRLRWLGPALAALGATGAREEVVKVPAPAGTGVPLVVAVGLGARARRYPGETLARAAGAATRSLAGKRRAVVALPASTPADAGAVAEGALLGAYVFLRFRAATKAAHKPGLAAITLSSTAAQDREVRAAVKRAQILAESVSWARDLVNTPPSHLTPALLAQAAVDAGSPLGLEIEVLDERALRRKGYGGIVGVGQGSANPPRLVRLAYRPAKPAAHLALVGKGITFDTGGISIKPALNMDWMKSDMGGAAAVFAATLAVARIGVPVSVTTYGALAENMPSGSAQRPSDILTTYSGRTVEVLDTDAEGRLVMCDALSRAQEDSPDVIVDIATLTGAQLVALGSRVAGVMSNDDAVRSAIHAAAERAGEQSWPMPLPPELRKGLDSPVADIANVDMARKGGMLSAGLFLQEFIGEGQRWAHLDVAGPAWNDREPWGLTPKGGTGFGVRTLVSYAESLA